MDYKAVQTQAAVIGSAFVFSCAVVCLMEILNFRKVLKSLKKVKK